MSEPGRDTATRPRKVGVYDRPAGADRRWPRLVLVALLAIVGAVVSFWLFGRFGS